MSTENECGEKTRTEIKCVVLTTTEIKCGGLTRTEIKCGGLMSTFTIETSFTSPVALCCVAASLATEVF